MDLSRLDALARPLFDLGPDLLAVLAFGLQLRVARRGDEDLVSDVVEKFAVECGGPISQKTKNGVIAIGREWARVRDVSLAVKTSSIISLAGVVSGALVRPGFVSALVVLAWLGLLLIVVVGDDRKNTVPDCRNTVLRLSLYFVIFTLITASLKLLPLILGETVKG